MKTFKFVSSMAVLSGCLILLPAWGQKFPTTPEQIATAQKVSQAGVPLSDLAPDAPDTYVVKRGDTLWAISNIFLRSPWRWPELWGMNLEEISNPHLIYPGQILVLDKSSGRAVLRNANSGDTTTPPVATSAGTETPAPSGPTLSISRNRDEPPLETVRLSPRTRVESFGAPLATLNTSAIEAFLSEPLIVEENEMASAPRIVAAQENRVMLTRGDRAYARGPSDAPLLDNQGKLQLFRVFGIAKPIKDPLSNEILGYEAQFTGKASLVRSETKEETEVGSGKTTTHLIPASIDILEAKDEIQVGFRMLPEPERQFFNYVPHAPSGPMEGRIVSIYSSSGLVNASQNQVVLINRGRRDGLENGHVMAVLKNGETLIDRTDPSRTLIKLPNERNGLLMVFKTFEKLSYGLILDITDGVRVGDRLVSPK
jgi:LysM repeat protein